MNPVVLTLERLAATFLIDCSLPTAPLRALYFPETMGLRFGVLQIEEVFFLVGIFDELLNRKVRPGLWSAPEFGHVAQAEQLAGLDLGDTEDSGDLIGSHSLRGQFAEDPVFFRWLLVYFCHVFQPGSLQIGGQACGFQADAEGLPGRFKPLVAEGRVDFALECQNSFGFLRCRSVR